MQTFKKSTYRQRVYLLADGVTIELVFGSDPAPDQAKLLADHDVMEQITITDHVEPIPPTP